jgi:hypothetical protein
MHDEMPPIANPRLVSSKVSKVYSRALNKTTI